MKKWTALTLVGLGLLATPHYVDAQVTKQGNSFLLRVKHTKGQKMTYNMAINTQMPSGMGGTAQRGKGGNTMTMNMPLTMTVTDVKNGIATIKTVSGPSKMMGSEIPRQEQTIKVDSLGNTVGTGSNMVNLAGGMPRKAVRIGESWTQTVDLGGAGGMGPGMKMTGTYTLRSVTGNIATLGVSMRGGQSAQMQISGTGTIRIRVNDGSMDGANLNINMKMSGMGDPKSKTPSTMNIATTMTVTRR